MCAWIFCRLPGPFAVKVMLTVLLIALMVVIMYTIVDILYGVIDPRVRFD